MYSFKQFISEKNKQKKSKSPIKKMDFSTPDDQDAGFGYWNYSVPSLDNKVVSEES